MSFRTDGQSLRPSILGHRIPHVNPSILSQRSFNTSLTRLSGPFSALTRESASTPLLLTEPTESEQVVQAEAEDVEAEGEWIDAEFEALEDARLDKALLPFESRE